MIFDDPFHRHLDVCERCREEPFNLCLVGRVLLEAQVKQTQRVGVHRQQVK